MEVIFNDELLQRLTMHGVVNVALWILVIGAIMLDLWDGIYTAKKTKQLIHSHKLRITVAKVCEYWRLMLIGFFIDTIGVLFPFYTLPFLSVVLGVGLICVEAKSMFEHAKARKSITLELRDIYKAMIEAATEDDAKSILKKISDILTDKNQTQKHQRLT